MGNLGHVTPRASEVSRAGRLGCPPPRLSPSSPGAPPSRPRSWRCWRDAVGRCRLVDGHWKDSSGRRLENEATVGNRVGGPGSWLSLLPSLEALNSFFFSVFCVSPLSL